jgi:hypothetical protein
MVARTKIMIAELELDSEGIVKTSPVTDYGTHPVFGTAILLRVEYVNSAEELETGIRHQIPLLLTRQSALNLAELLRISAQRVQDPISDQPTH